jgi:hypothetical protein
MTELLERILASREDSKMEHMVKGLVSKGKVGGNTFMLIV